MEEIDSMQVLVTNPENKEEFYHNLKQKLESGIFEHLINKEKYGIIIKVSFNVVNEGDKSDK